MALVDKQDEGPVTLIVSIVPEQTFAMQPPQHGSLICMIASKAIDSRPAHSPILLLSRCIENIEQGDLAVYHALFTV